jgi:UDP-2,3-diacylglucosamine hydrolase
MSDIKTAYFVGDVHLDPRVPERERAFCKFLDMVAEQAPDALFLMGDIFEFWFGYKTVMFTDAISVIAKLASIADSGTKITYIVGNHDFKPGPVFSEHLGLEIAYDPIVRVLGSRKVYISHGDEINYLDKGYRFLKSILRNRFMQTAFKLIPVSWAWYIGRITSDTSRRYTQHKNEIPEKVYQHFFEKCAGNGINVILHGHTHKPEVKHVSAGEKSLLLINSGHWFGPGHFVRFKDGEFELAEFSIS